MRDLIAEVKNLRVEISKVTNRAMEVAEAIDRGKGGAGKILGELGSRLPEEYRDEV